MTTCVYLAELRLIVYLYLGNCKLWILHWQWQMQKGVGTGWQLSVRADVSD